MGTMGYSIPAAMGAKYALKDKQVIAVCGDGSFQMSMMELATMKQHGIQNKVIDSKTIIWVWYVSISILPTRIIILL